MDLLIAVSNIASLKKFIEKDLVSLLISLELGAAAQALSGLDSAKDKRSVYWSTINHLEVVEQGLIHKLKTSRRFDAAKQYIYISSLKAAIYKYLQEDGLVEKCFKDSLEVVEIHNVNAKKKEFSDIFSAWNPLGWFEMIRFRKSEIGKMSLDFNAREFWQRFAEKNGSFGLLLIDPDPGPNGYYMEYK